MTSRALPLTAAAALAVAATALAVAAPGPAAALGPPPGASSVPLTLAAGTGAAPFDTPRTVTVPPGWTAEVWARVSGARMAVWTPAGDLLVSNPGAGTVTRLHPASDPAAAPAVSTVLTGLDQPHGLAVDGSTLLVAQSTRVDRYPLTGATTGAPTPVVTGLPDSKSPELHGQYAHALKSVAVGPDRTIYVTVGSTGNTSPEDLTATPPRAAVLAVNPDGTGLRRFATGVRNGEGLSFDPDGALWTAVNNRDNIAVPAGEPQAGQVVQAYVNDHPTEELARLTPGRDLGWPYCNPNPDVSADWTTSALHYDALRYQRDEQQNADGGKLDCSALTPIERGIPAHSAPLGLSFLTGSRLPATWAAGAVVGIHGSWNRTPPRAPELTWFPWDVARHTLGEQVTLLGGFQLSDGSRWGRVVDAVPGPDGALYITDDTAGAVYRLVPPAAPAAPAGVSVPGAGSAAGTAAPGTAAAGTTAAAARAALVAATAGAPGPGRRWGVTLRTRPRQALVLTGTLTRLTGRGCPAAVPASTAHLAAGCRVSTTRLSAVVHADAAGHARAVLPASVRGASCWALRLAVRPAPGPASHTLVFTADTRRPRLH